MPKESFLSYHLLVQPPPEDEVKNCNESSSKSKMSKGTTNVRPSLIIQPSNNIICKESTPSELTKSLAEFNGHRNSLSEVIPQHTTPPKLQKDQVEDVFSDMVTNTPAERDRILVVLDCANIGWAFGGDMFNATGIRLALEYFSKLDVEVKAFIPASYVRAKPSYKSTQNNSYSYPNSSSRTNATGSQNNPQSNALMQTDDVDYLQDLAGGSLLSIVPSGDYDDAYILNYARDNCGFVVSNDFFNDHIQKIQTPQVRNSMRIWLGENRSGYTFVNHSEFLPNPGSKMSFAISSRGIEQQLKMNEKCAIYDNNGGSRSLHSTLNNNNDNDAAHATLLSIVQSLTSAANGLHGLQRGRELKHVLLARATLLIELNMLIPARSDLTFLLTVLDPICDEAKTLYERCVRAMGDRERV